MARTLGNGTDTFKHLFERVASRFHEPHIELGQPLGIADHVDLACAGFAHLRVRWYSTIAWPATFLLLVVGALLLRLGSL